MTLRGHYPRRTRLTWFADHEVLWNETVQGDFGIRLQLHGHAVVRLSTDRPLTVGDDPPQVRYPFVFDKLGCKSTYLPYGIHLQGFSLGPSGPRRRDHHGGITPKIDGTESMLVQPRR